jgi:hypothetical protein
LELKHQAAESLVNDQMAFVAMADLPVLAVDTKQVAAAENGARAVPAHHWSFLA